ncbi:MAG: MarR family transcriptional regulator [Polyangiaceae bacterium]|nr:MarR family transcriptional regulator [Polyangiaceae bacterium]
MARAKEPDEREKVIGDLVVLGRELSARTVLFHDAVASRIGLSATESKCLDIAVRSNEPITAGKLAEQTGLTTGAITGVLDRLERAGFIRREKDENDRRQVLIRVLHERLKPVEAIFSDFRAAWEKLLSKYTVDELVLVREYLTRSIDLCNEQTARVREDVASEPIVEPVVAGEIASPLGDVRRGTLEFVRGAAELSLDMAAGSDLYRARFDGEPPRIAVAGGNVTVDYKRSALRLFDWRRRAGAITLNQGVPWALVVRGGISNVRADLRAGSFRGIEISGGAHHLELALGAVQGTAQIRIAGGADGIRISRPPSVPARVRIGSGAHKLELDTLSLGAVGGETKWASPGYDAADDRLDIEIGGGAHHVVLGSN